MVQRLCSLEAVAQSPDPQLVWGLALFCFLAYPRGKEVFLFLKNKISN